MDQPAEPVEIALAGGVATCSCAQEEQALDRRVVEGVQQRGGEGQRGEAGMPVAGRQRQPKPKDDDADILDGANRPAAF